jgi:hypothetical protein
MNTKLESATQGPKPRYRRLWVWFGVILTVLCGVFAVWRGMLAADVSRELDKITVAGLPIGGKQLNAYYPDVPIGSNAALMMDRAFKQLTRPIPRDQALLDHIDLLRNGILTDEDWRAMENWLSLNTNVIATVDEALKIPQCRYFVDYSMGYNSPVPHLRAIKKISMLSQFQARLMIQREQWQDAIVAAARIPRLARTLENEPSISAQDTRIIVMCSGCGELQYYLGTHQPDESALSLFEGAFEYNETNAVLRGVVGDRAMLLPYFRLGLKDYGYLGMILNTQSSPSPQVAQMGPPTSFLSATGLLERDLLSYLKTLDSVLQICQLPPPQWCEAGKLLRKYRDTVGGRLVIPRVVLLSTDFAYIDKVVDCIAQVRMARAAIAVERYRLSSGKLPDSLAILVPQFLSSLPVDPFDGQPLRFKRMVKGYVIYSVGPDGVDNGGKEQIKNSKDGIPGEPNAASEPWDISFIVER